MRPQKLVLTYVEWNDSPFRITRSFMPPPRGQLVHIDHQGEKGVVLYWMVPA